MATYRICPTEQYKADPSPDGKSVPEPQVVGFSYDCVTSSNRKSRDAGNTIAFQREGRTGALSEERRKAGQPSTRRETVREEVGITE